MNVMRHSIAQMLSSSVIACALYGCATYKPVPEGYTGPVATLTDSGLAESSSKAQIYALMEVNGNPVDNTFNASAAASRGQGFRLVVSYVQRDVPAQPMKVKLKAAHATGAPIQAIFSQAAGTFYSVEGEVDFVPAAGRSYIVKGELSKDGSAVWIEDMRSYEVVTQKVTAK